MVKKIWSNPEILALGLENTKDDSSSEFCSGNIFHICPKCYKNFKNWQHKEFRAHVASCNINSGDGEPPLS